MPWTLTVDAPFLHVASVFNALACNVTRSDDVSRAVLRISQPWQALAPRAGSTADVMLLVDAVSQVHILSF